MITLELLTALLSPDPKQRCEAETYYQTKMNTMERIQGLVQFLMSSQQQQQQQQQYQLLSAVLLRRQILKLTNPNQLNELIKPLGQCFTTTNNNNNNNNNKFRLQIGHCLAELCFTMSLVVDGNSNTNNKGVEDILSMIITMIEPFLLQLDIPSFKLLSTIADRVPNAFSMLVVSKLPQLISQAITATTTTISPDTIEALLQLIVNAAIASSSSSSKTYDSNNNTTSNNDDLEEVVVDESSIAATTLGPHCLCPLLSQMTSNTTNMEEELIMTCLQHLSHAATTCPSLLAGQTNVLNTVAGMCLQIITTLTTNSNNDDDMADSSNSNLGLSALQVITSLISIDDVKHRILPANIELVNGILSTSIPYCTQCIVFGVDKDSVEEWAVDPAKLVMDNTNNGMDYWEDDDQAIYAETLLEDLLQHLGIAALSVVLPFIQDLLLLTNTTTTNDWRRPRAGLAMLECCLVATPVSLKPHIPVVMDAALSLSTITTNNNNNVRVQWQAIRLLGALCEVSTTLFDIRPTYARQILEPLAQAVQSNCTKVSTMACLALVSYCRGGTDTTTNDRMDPTQVLTPYLTDIISALVQGPLSLPTTTTMTDSATATGIVTVKVRAMGAIACLAEASSSSNNNNDDENTTTTTGFNSNLYQNVMPGLLSYINDKDLDIASAAIQATTIIGQSIGRTIFVNDAIKLLNWIVPLLSSSSNNNNNNTTIPMEQLLSACARIASVLQEDFSSQYIDAILPHLLHRIQEPPDVSIMEGNETGYESTKRQEFEIEDDGNESMTVALPGRGLTKVTINTTKIQDKAQATRAIYEFATALGINFGPYAERCLTVLLPLISFPYSPDVRGVAAQSSAAVFDSACLFGEQQQQQQLQLPQKYLPLLATAISKQIAEEDPMEIENLYALADALSEIYYIVYRYKENPMMYGQQLITQFTLENAKVSVQNCMKAMIACLERRSVMTRVLSGTLTGDDERNEYIEKLSSEEMLLTPLVDSVGYTLKFFRNQFGTIFDQYIVPVLGPYLTSRTDIRATVSATCLFDDCIEHCGVDIATKYAPQLLNGIMVTIQQLQQQNTTTEEIDTDLLSASFYGIAQLARYVPRQMLTEHLPLIIHQLLAITSSSNNNDEEEKSMVIENAISALASLTLFGPNTTSGDIKFVNRDVIIDTFLSHLPIENDPDEAKICHSGLCDIIENGYITNMNIEVIRVTKIIGEILSMCMDDDDDNDDNNNYSLATPETCSRFATILIQLQSTIPSTTLQQAVSSLSPEAQMAINSAIVQQQQQRCNVVTP